MKLIALSGRHGQGKFIKVDDEDFEELNKYKWHAIRVRKTNNYYGARSVFNKRIRIETVLIHRQIMGCKKFDNKIIDHKDHDTFNCQRSNLRFSINGGNQKNMTSKINSTSKYLGVSWCKKRSRWVTQIKHNKKRVYCGVFKIEKEAAKKYNELAKIYHGEFANLNILT